VKNTADVTGGKPIAVLLQSISGVSAINPLVAFYDIHGGKREVLFFYLVPDTTRDFLIKRAVCRIVLTAISQTQLVHIKSSRGGHKIIGLRPHWAQVPRPDPASKYLRCVIGAGSIPARPWEIKLSMVCYKLLHRQIVNRRDRGYMREW
jgi:hypothetical protein